MLKRGIRILAVGFGVFLLLLTLVTVWAYYNQEAIIAKARQQAESSLNGKLEIGGFSFKPFSSVPGLTFSMSDIRLTDSLFHTHQKPFADIKRLEVTFGLETLFLWNISIRKILVEEGEVFIFVRRDSYSNTSIFQVKKREEKRDHKSFDDLFSKVNSLELRNIHMAFADSLKEKFYGAEMQQVSGHYRSTATGWDAELTGPVHVDQLVFNSEKGGFLKNRNIFLNAAVRIDHNRERFSILPKTYVRLETKERINVSGSFATSGSQRPMNFRFKTHRIRVPVATSVLADSIAVKIDKLGIDTYVAADVTLNGFLGEKNPWVNVNFKTDTFRFATAVGYFRGIKARGLYTNRSDTLLAPGLTNSEIRSEKITGYFEKVPVKGSLRIQDLSVLKTKVVMHARADSGSLNSLLDADRYHVSKGAVELDLNFDGQLINPYNAAKDSLNGTLSGNARVTDLAIAYKPKKIKLSRIESNILITQDDIVIRRLDFFDNQNELFVKGKLSHYLHHLLGSKEPVKASLDINIPSWKLNWIEVLAEQSSLQRKKNGKNFSRVIDQLAGALEIDANINARQLSYHSFSARNVSGRLSMTRNIATISGLRLDAFGGHVTLDGKMTSPENETSLANFSASGKVQQADVSKVLYSFADFGQKALSSKNVQGVLDLDFRLSSELKPDVSLVPKSMDGHLDISLKEGRLINFEPFIKMKRIIFKKRPLENVKIAPIRKRFILRGQEVKVDMMQIESNVLTLFVEGQYSFGNKTDLSIQFPLKNFKKRDEDYEFQDYDADELRSLFLRAIDENGEVNIRMDSRKKARRRLYPTTVASEKDSAAVK
ncbi:hypothetical protein GCM10023091_15290 [Ravibacter arvi]|uniref:AsmA-like protein n=1 Tax=Ravibacter arvi TaxID=2051041 RepID=A0ABP8LVM9_9BACT